MFAAQLFVDLSLVCKTTTVGFLSYPNLVTVDWSGPLLLNENVALSWIQRRMPALRPVKDVSLLWARRSLSSLSRHRSVLVTGSLRFDVPRTRLGSWTHLAFYLLWIITLKEIFTSPKSFVHFRNIFLFLTCPRKQIRKLSCQSGKALDPASSLGNPRGFKCQPSVYSEICSDKAGRPIGKRNICAWEKCICRDHKHNRWLEMISD